MNMSGSSGSATSVIQNYPTWLGPPNPDAGYGDKTAYDTTDGVASEVATNWMPMYLASALKMANFPGAELGNYANLFNTGYLTSVTGSATVTAVGGVVQSAVIANATQMASGQMYQVGSLADPAIIMVMKPAAGGSTGYGLTVTMTGSLVGPLNIYVLTSATLADGGQGYAAGQAVRVLPDNGYPYYFDVLTVNANGSVTALANGHSSGGSLQAYTNGIHETQMIPPILTGPSTVNCLVIYGGSGYTSTTYNITPAVNGETFAEFTNANVTDPATPDGITFNPTISKYANMTQNEKDAITAMNIRGSVGDPLTNSAVGVLNTTLGGSRLNGNIEFVDMLARSTGVAKSAFTALVYPRILAKTLINGNPELTFLGQTLVTDGATSTKWGDRYDAMLYDDNFRVERYHQNNDISLAASYGDLAYVNAEGLRTAGVWNRQYVHGRLKDNYEAIYANDTLRLRALDVLGDSISSTMGMRITSTKPYVRPSGWGAVAAGALAGGLASDGNPYAIAGGAALGLLSSASENGQF